MRHGYRTLTIFLGGLVAASVLAGGADLSAQKPGYPSLGRTGQQLRGVEASRRADRRWPARRRRRRHEVEGKIRVAGRGSASGMKSAWRASGDHRRRAGARDRRSAKRHGALRDRGAARHQRARGAVAAQSRRIRSRRHRQEGRDRRNRTGRPARRTRPRLGPAAGAIRTSINQAARLRDRQQGLERDGHGEWRHLGVQRHHERHVGQRAGRWSSDTSSRITRTSTRAGRCAKACGFRWAAWRRSRRRKRSTTTGYERSRRSAASSASARG